MVLNSQPVLDSCSLWKWYAPRITNELNQRNKILDETQNLLRFQKTLKTRSFILEFNTILKSYNVCKTNNIFKSKKTNNKFRTENFAMKN